MLALRRCVGETGGALRLTVVGQAIFANEWPHPDRRDTSRGLRVVDRDRRSGKAESGGGLEAFRTMRS